MKVPLGVLGVLILLLAVGPAIGVGLFLLLIWGVISYFLQPFRPGLKDPPTKA